MNNKSVTILGAGCWGISIASVLEANGCNVIIWDKDSNLICELSKKKNHPNINFLNLKNYGFKFTADIKEALTFSNIVFTVIPAQAYETFFIKIKNYVRNHIFINCSKGISLNNNKLISQIFLESFPLLPKGNFLVLSGPSYANEVLKKVPTAVTIAGKNKKIAVEIQKILSNSWFRVYTNDDVVGVEIGGAIKNVIAIASGIIKGLGYGCNTQAALITRGNAEIMRLGRALGAKQKTFFGLSGIGDLILTTTSEQSRNFSFGLLLGKGLNKNSAINKIKTTIEGIETVKAAIEIAKLYSIEMPICETVYNILFSNKNPNEELIKLMNREVKPE